MVQQWVFAGIVAVLVLYLVWSHHKASAVIHKLAVPLEPPKQEKKTGEQMGQEKKPG